MKNLFIVIFLIGIPWLIKSSETTDLSKLPSDMKIEIIEKMIEDADDKKSILEVINTIGSLSKTSSDLANFIDHNKDKLKNLLKNKVAQQVMDARKIDAFEALSLKDAAILKSTILAEILVELGSTIDEANQALYKAAENNASGVAKFLIEKRVDVKQNRHLEGTPLHVAAKSNAMNVAKILLEAGADVNATIPPDPQRGIAEWDIHTFKKTPLHKAAQHNSIDVAKLLIDKGANTSAKDYQGRTPYEYARSEEMKKLLISGGSIYERTTALIKETYDAVKSYWSE